MACGRVGYCERRFDIAVVFAVFAAAAVGCFDAPRKRAPNPAPEKSVVVIAAKTAIEKYRTGLRSAADKLQTQSFSDWPSAFKAWSDAAASARADATETLDAAVNQEIDGKDYSDELFRRLLKDISDGL